MINSLIVNILSEYINRKDVKYLKYSGTADTYAVFNYADERGANYADDEPEDIENSIQVHIFTKSPAVYKAIKGAVREALFKAGFSYLSIAEQYEKENNYYHVVYECEFVEGRE